mmetsp:Transcript_6424/g.23824  ORF Transcript_6424/g.23824 Transcript_6424/m.23824 type:complete len:267 (-) Transcript_6424:374-1174(-)
MLEDGVAPVGVNTPIAMARSVISFIVRGPLNFVRTAIAASTYLPWVCTAGFCFADLDKSASGLSFLLTSCEREACFFETGSGSALVSSLNIDFATFFFSNMPDVEGSVDDGLEDLDPFSFDTFVPPGVTRASFKLDEARGELRVIRADGPSGCVLASGVVDAPEPARLRVSFLPTPVPCFRSILLLKLPAKTAESTLAGIVIGTAGSTAGTRATPDRVVREWDVWPVILALNEGSDTRRSTVSISLPPHCCSASSTCSSVMFGTAS